MHSWDQIIQEQFGARHVGRDAAAGPLTEDDWKAIDAETIDVLRTSLTARQAFAPIIDTSISGAQMHIESWSKSDSGDAVLSLTGEPAPSDLRNVSPEQILAPVLSKDTRIPYRIREMAQGSRIPLLQDAAADNAKHGAQKEDAFAYTGQSGIADGFLAVTGRTTAAGADWSAAAANPETDVLDMLEDLETNDIQPEQTNPVLFVHPTDGRSLRQRFASGSDTTVEQHLLDTSPLADVVRTKRQSVGTASLIAVDRAYMRWYLLEDWRNESYMEGNSERSSSVLGTWSIQALKVRHAEAFIERTAI